MRNAFSVSARVGLALPLLVRRAQRAGGVALERLPRGARERRVPEARGALDQQRGLAGDLDVVVDLRLVADLGGHVPAGAERRGVEPARVVPAGHVRRDEQHLPGLVAQPAPRRRVDAAADGPQHPGGLHDRRLDHPAIGVVQVRVAQDRVEQRAHAPAVRDVDPLERAGGAARRRRRDEVAPQLVDEERRVLAMADVQAHRVAPVEAPALAVHALDAAVVELAVEAEVVRPAAVRPVVAPAGERPRELAHVALAVAAPGAEREQLHQLTGVVLVDVPLGVVGAVEPQQHRRVARDAERELLERAERVAPQHRVLAQHQRGRRAVLAGGEPVVPDQRHALHERRLRADHAVQPPAVVVTPGVARRERAAVLVVRPGALQALRMRVRQRVDGAVEPALGELLGLAGLGSEPRAPQQATGFVRAEMAAISRDAGHARVIVGNTRSTLQSLARRRGRCY